MAQPPKKTGTPAVRGRPQGAPGAASGSRGLPAQTNDGRVVSLEAGKALQRVLDTAPHAAVQARVEGPGRGVAERALAAASSLELHIAALPISAALVAQRVEELRRMISMTEPRAFAQPVEAGDEVELDLLGYIDGKLFLAQQAGWFDVAANVFLPGLFESLIGIAPPDNAVVQMRLPDHYPVAEHRGQVAAFAITVRRAQKRILPDVDDPIFLQLTSRKATTRAELEAVLVGELTQERARLCVDEAKMQLLRDLYVKVGVDDHVPDELVEDELRRRWKQHIGDALALQGITVEEQKKSLADYSNAAQRSESRRTVWEHRCLEAVADHEGVDATEGELHKIVEQLAPDIRKGDIEALLYQHAALSKDLVTSLRLHRALVVLLGRAKIAFDGTPRPIDKLLTPLPSGPSGSGSGSASGSGGARPAGDTTAIRGLKRPPPKAL